MAVALETVVKQLADSGIISQGQLENFVPPKAHPTSVEELVAQLVKEHHLTKFQAAQVAAGKAKSLILGGYTILDKIGAGGMGQVFKAEHRRMKRPVAIKMLPPAMTKDAAAVARFQREVEAAAKLRHPNIVAADDADEANGVHFLVMEYVGGKDLSAMVKKDGPFPVAKAVNCILQAARGLEFAHKKGVVHRDIKPANLLLDAEGTVKILDMGLARIESQGNVAAQAELTGTGAVMGTVDYMAPEQGMSTKHADARADIYSLGCSLYYLLIGKAVYGGETIAAKLVAHHNTPIPDLRLECPEVSEQLDTVFKKMVAKRLEDRYQTMTEVIADLERLGGNSAKFSDPYAATAAIDKGSLAALQGINVSVTTAKTAATKQVAAVKPSGGKQPPWKNVKVLIGASAVGLALLLGVIVIVRNKDGKEVARLEVADGNSVEVQPTTPQTSTKALPQSTSNADRFLAELALAKKWGFTITVGGKTDVGPHKQLPEEPFIVTALTVNGTLVDTDYAAIAAAENLESLLLLGGPDLQLDDSTVFQFEKYKSFNKLRTLKITDSQITDAVVGILERMPSLRSLHIPRNSISNEGIEQLSRLPLNAFGIGSDLLTNEVFDRFGPMPSLTNLTVETGSNGLMTDVAFKQLSSRLKASNKLDRLDFTGAAITDNVIANFHSISQLRFLYLARSAVTENGMASFKDALPNCLIFSDLKEYRGSTPNTITNSPTPPLAVAPFDAAQAKAHQKAWAKHLGTEVETTNSVGMKMVLIPPGEFLMGSTDEQVEAALKVADVIECKSDTKDRIQKNERPQHRVVITKPFFMGATEVTIGQFKKFATETGYKTKSEKISDTNTYLKPSYVVTDDSPAASITWNDAVAFCQWLSMKERVTYRLPTDAEWEYACRAGTTTQYSFGDDHQQLDQYGWYNKNAGGRSHAVGTKLPNGFGLYDLHGNVNEWCGDFYGEQWYETSPNNDPVGPEDGSTHITRGGHFKYIGSITRSACRGKATPTSSYHDLGFRIVRELPAPSTTATITPQPTVPAAAPAKPITDFNAPEFLAWIKEVQTMPAEEQIKAVSKKLMELNPGFDGNETHKIENDTVTEFVMASDHLSDLSPVRALSGLKVLECSGVNSINRKLSDLSPLSGLHLTKLVCFNTRVADLSPLREMPLEDLHCANTQVSNLSPLQGMPLKKLSLGSLSIPDLTPLRGMPLTYLACGYSKIGDPSPLEDCKSLTTLNLKSTSVTPASVAALQKALPNCKIEWDDPAMATTPKPDTTSKLFIHDPTFPQWVKEVQAMPAEEQIEAVSKKLMELNAGFDGVVMGENEKGVPKIENGVVTACGVVTDNISDISPIRALVGLKALNCYGKSKSRGKLSDLSPLRGLALEKINCGWNPIADLSPLSGMPLTLLVTGETNASDLSSLKGMPLMNLQIPSTLVSDLTPLRGLPLTKLVCQRTLISDLSPLEDCKSLALLDVRETKVTAATVAALQKALPNCKIEWDDPVKATTPQPAPSSKLFIHDPAFPQWMAQVQAMPAEDQLEAVSKKLMELNTGFDGRLTRLKSDLGPKIDGGVVSEIAFSTDEVSDISPVRALTGLKVLSCIGSPRILGKISDLSPLRGMPLTNLVCYQTRITDLSPLKGMPLNALDIGNTKVSDLSPLQGMQLTVFACGTSAITDLSPLRGMPLKFLKCDNTPLSDLSALADCKQLETVIVQVTKVTPASVAALQKALPNCIIEWDDPAKATPPQPTATAKLFMHDPAFPQWMAQVQAMPADEQIAAVSKKLMELNPGFDGKLGWYGDKDGYDGNGLPKIENGVIKAIGFFTDKVTDISPICAFVELKSLGCNGSHPRSGILEDLRPLAGMKLTRLAVDYCKANDLTPLRDMPLTWFSCSGTKVSNLSPLQGMLLEVLYIAQNPVTDLRPLSGMPLKVLGCPDTPLKDLSPLKGMPLWKLTCFNTKVNDLSPLAGMQISILQCWKSDVADLSPLREVPLQYLDVSETKVADVTSLAASTTLKNLRIVKTDVPPTQVAALQKALPNCKIEWNDPTKATTPQPTASGTK